MKLKHLYKILHLFCGIGGSAIGTGAASVRFGEHEAAFECAGGVDFSALAVEDFIKLTGSKAVCRDLHEMQPAELLALCPQVPDVVMMSPPCKGFSGLISQAKSEEPKYQKMNTLLLDALFLITSTWKTAPRVIFIENVPRIAKRGKKLIQQACSLLEQLGYAVHMGNHDCGEIGHLGQRRRRWFLVARHVDSTVHFVYHAPKKGVQACGAVLHDLPTPGDVELGGPMHALPKLSWQNWVRLALIPPGGDWRDLAGVLEPGQPRREKFRRHVVADWNKPTDTVTGPGGSAAENVADPRVACDSVGSDDGSPGGAGGVRGLFTGESTHVTPWDQPSRTVTGSGRVQGSGASAVADPRLDGISGRRSGSMKVGAWTEPADTVTGADPTSQGGRIVADPRVTSPLQLATDNPDRHWNKYAVSDWNEPAHTVTGCKSSVGSGAPSVNDPRFAVADPRMFVGVDRGHLTTGPRVGVGIRCKLRNGAYKVLSYQEAAATITGSLSIDNGAAAVADPRLPALEAKRQPPWIPVIIAADGTWHRPLTTLELAALQGFPLRMPDGSPLVLACAKTKKGKDKSAHTRWREAIGNAVPPPAAEAVGDQLLAALLLSDLGQERSNGERIWVQPWRDALRKAAA